MKSSTAVQYEKLAWRSQIPLDLLPRRQQERLQQPYRAAITPPIAELDLTLPDSLVGELTDAQEQIIRFDNRVGHVSAPYSAILLRSESASSSQIENLTSGARAIAEAELDERDTGNGPLIVANVRAMEAALEASDDLSHQTIIGMHEQLSRNSAPAITGRYRTEQVWVGGDNYGPQDADFVPPHHDRVYSAMADFITYSLRPAPMPLASTAVAHAQFETIHPFPDGNGRAGRALVQAALRRSGLTASVTVPISAGILQQRDRYFEALTSYREGNLEPIVEVFARGTSLAVANGARLVADIESVQQRWEEALSGVRSDAAARRIAKLAMRHPVLNSRLVRAKVAGSDRTVFTGLDLLVVRGVLAETTSRKRNRLWVSHDVLDALDGFTRRSLRRV